MLRFIDFRDNWTVSSICNTTSYVDYRGKTPTKSSEGVFLVTAKNIKMGYIDYECSKEYIPKETYLEVMRRGYPTIGDVLITTEAPLGNVASVDRTDVALAQRVIKYRGLHGVIDNSYLKQYFLSSKFQRELQSKATGSTAKGIKGSVLHKLRIAYPSLPEQQKIAAFLTAVDNRIQQLSKKKALLEQYKKGVIQQIFSQEIRFKNENGSEYPEWEEKELGELLNFKQPTNYIVTDTNYSDTYETPVLTAGKTFILGYTAEVTGIFKENLPIIIFDDFTTATQFVDFPFKVKSSAMKILMPKPGVNAKFVYEAMQNIKYEIGGHGRHWISIFARITVFVPSIEEQTKIANLLSALDDKVKHVDQQIELTKQYKKGLLQQMFV